MEYPYPLTDIRKQVARASAVLLAAGAWDAVPLELPCQEMKNVTVFFKYTRGGAAGAFNFKIEVSNDGTGTDWFQNSLYDAGILAAGSDTTSNIQREDITYTAVGATAELVVYGPIPILGTIERLRIVAREIGNVGAPGTLQVEVMFS